MTNAPFQTENEHNHQKKLFRGRLYVALAFTLVLLGALFGRMTYLQWHGYAHYYSMAEGNRISLEPIPPVRGRIFDRNHLLIADNQPVFALKFSTDKIENIADTMARLHTILPGLSEQRLARFEARLKVSSKHRPVFLPYTLSEAEAARFAGNSYQFPGITLVAKLKRTYPFGSAAVHALGYVGKINQNEASQLDEARYAGTDVIGKLGIEKFYESILHGYPGLQQVETNARGRVLRKLETVPAQPGQDIQLTIDIRLQQYIEDYLGDKKAAVVVMQPKTGDILAYVSSPAYDPNLFVEGISQKDYKALLENPYRPLVNRVLNGQYPPGSTIKPFVALTAIEGNIISPYKKIYDPGYFEYKNQRYRDWKRQGHGLVDMNDAIVQSCDTYFYELSLDMGIDMIHDGLYPFGFGHKTGIDQHDESIGILPSKAWKQNSRGESWYNGETIIAAIGQGYFTATPLQLAKSAAIMANRGEIVEPHLLKEKQTAPKKQIPIGDIENWDKAIQSMVNVLHHPRGTAYQYARGLDFEMAGKTGTAQVFSLNEGEYDEENIRKTLRDHSLFIGFAPADKPEVAISVIIENSTLKAAPVAVDIVKYYLTERHHEN